MEANTVFSGRLREADRALGAVGCMLVALKSIGASTPSGAVIQFVAFGIKSGGLWGA